MILKVGKNINFRVGEMIFRGKITLVPIHSTDWVMVCSEELNDFIGTQNRKHAIPIMTEAIIK